MSSRRRDGHGYRELLKSQIPEPLKGIQVALGYIVNEQGTRDLIQIDHYAGNDESGGRCYFECVWPTDGSPAEHLFDFVDSAHRSLAEQRRLDLGDREFVMYANTKAGVFVDREPWGVSLNKLYEKIRGEVPSFIRADGPIFSAAIELSPEEDYNVSEGAVISFSSYFQLADVIADAYHLSIVDFRRGLAQAQTSHVVKALDRALSRYLELSCFDRVAFNDHQQSVS